MQRYGQYSIVEQTVLFAVGLSIALGFLFAFEQLGTGFQEDTADVQTELVAKYMAMNAVELVESEAEGSYAVNVPETVAQQQYAILFGPDGVEVVARGVRASSGLYGLLSRIGADGIVESGQRRAEVAFADGVVTVGETGE